jgi:hypothetical protein
MAIRSAGAKLSLNLTTIRSDGSGPAGPAGAPGSPGATGPIGPPFTTAAIGNLYTSFAALTAFTPADGVAAIVWAGAGNPETGLYARVAGVWTFVVELGSPRAALSSRSYHALTDISGASFVRVAKGGALDGAVDLAGLRILPFRGERWIWVMRDADDKVVAGIDRKTGGWDLRLGRYGLARVLEQLVAPPPLVAPDDEACAVRLRRGEEPGLPAIAEYSAPYRGVLRPFVWHTKSGHTAIDHKYMDAHVLYGNSTAANRARNVVDAGNVSNAGNYVPAMRLENLPNDWMHANLMLEGRGAPGFYEEPFEPKSYRGFGILRSAYGLAAGDVITANRVLGQDLGSLAHYLNERDAVAGRNPRPRLFMAAGVAGAKLSEVLSGQQAASAPGFAGYQRLLAIIAHAKGMAARQGQILCVRSLTICLGENDENIAGATLMTNLNTLLDTLPVAVQAATGQAALPHVLLTQAPRTTHTVFSDAPFAWRTIAETRGLTLFPQYPFLFASIEHKMPESCALAGETMAALHDAHVNGVPIDSVRQTAVTLVGGDKIQVTYNQPVTIDTVLLPPAGGLDYNTNCIAGFRLVDTINNRQLTAISQLSDTVIELQASGAIGAAASMDYAYEGRQVAFTLENDRPRAWGNIRRRDRLGQSVILPGADLHLWAAMFRHQFL